MMLFLLVLTLFTAGCSQTEFVKAGATQQQVDADKLDCQDKMVRMYGDYAQMQMGDALMERRDDWRRCMYTKGYREVTDEELKRDTAKQH